MNAILRDRPGTPHTPVHLQLSVRQREPAWDSLEKDDLSSDKQARSSFPKCMHVHREAFLYLLRLQH